MTPSLALRIAERNTVTALCPAQRQTNAARATHAQVKPVENVVHTQGAAQRSVTARRVTARDVDAVHVPGGGGAAYGGRQGLASAVVAAASNQVPQPMPDPDTPGRGAFVVVRFRQAQLWRKQRPLRRRHKRVQAGKVCRRQHADAAPVQRVERFQHDSIAVRRTQPAHDGGEFRIIHTGFR